MCRFGLAKKLKVGQNFGGIVLSSEATKVMSPEDYDIIAQHGIAGINCSWNR
jgi:pre-rRNA-processing protein TSR3